MDSFFQIESTLFLSFERDYLEGNHVTSSSTSATTPEEDSLDFLTDIPVDQDRTNSSSLVGLCVIS